MKEPPVFITRLELRNYKSIAECRVDLRELTFLVGPNGSGKSNCLDSLRFVAESLRTSLDHALRDRGTIKEVRRRSAGHPNHFTIGLEFRLPGKADGRFEFRIGARPSGGFGVEYETCTIRGKDGMGSEFYRVEGGAVRASSVGVLPAAFADRLFLVAASGVPQFRPVYDALSQIEIYNLNPREIAAMQRPDPGRLLRRDGGNAASVFQSIPESARERVLNYLQRIVPGLSGAETRILGAQETLEFRQGVEGQKQPWRFLASSMSDGTLRAFGVLLALFQEQAETLPPPMLIGLEEPEMALHPAASGVLLGALREASTRVQVLVTSHSPDLLDDTGIQTDSILAVESRDGDTRVDRVDEAGRSLLRDRLFSAGELLRQGQLRPEPAAGVEDAGTGQIDLFEASKP